MEESALKAMFDKLIAMNVLPLYFPNVDQDKPTDTHLRVSVLPTNPDKLHICSGKSKHTWILQVAIYCKEGVGQIVPARHADSLRNGIPVNTELNQGGYTFHTETQGEIIPAVQSSDGWFFIPVQFRVCIFN